MLKWMGGREDMLHENDHKNVRDTHEDEVYECHTAQRLYTL